MDPVRNPYAPGAGQRPPELAGRDRELDAFDVVLERASRGRPERSLVLTGLFSERHPDGYVPAHMENGRLVPGQFR